MLDPNSLKKGTVFKYKASPVQVLDFSHTHKGRGSATVTVKIKDLVSGGVQTVTYKAQDKIEEADLVRKEADYLYQDQTEAYFMETDSFEQVSLNKDSVEKLLLLKEGQKVTVSYFEGSPIDIDLPPKVDLKVTQSEPGIKGDTASGTAYKPATLETGLTVQVPLFINQGEIIRINTETGEYVERSQN